MPRIIDKQHQRSKHTAESPSKYWRSLRIPYLDSIFTYHKERFSEDLHHSHYLNYTGAFQTMSIERLNNEISKLSRNFIINRT